MKKFLDKDFLLQTEAAKTLYHDFASPMPIIDYHCHLPVDQIAADLNFQNMTQIWLYGDHYKWRAMRANGVDESFCTGDRDDFAKFEKWAATVPYTARNPLFHWTHLELQRYFDVHEVLTPHNARAIYDRCTALLQTGDFSVRNLLRRMNVRVVCTTDDPTDDLRFHRQIRDDGFEIRVLPAFRPDKAMNVDDAKAFNAYLAKLEAVSGMEIRSYSSYLEALKQRHDFFSSMGCSVSDHGLEHLYAEEYTEAGVRDIFDRVRGGAELSAVERLQFRSAVLHELALLDWEKGWVQQFHLGAFRNGNQRMMQRLGPDTGWDSIGDYPQAKHLAAFLNGLDKNGRLTKTILYNLNPSDNELIAAMCGNFNDGSVPGKMQFGSGWWFLDQKDGMLQQMKALSNIGLLSRMVGMLTDSRSFLSYPRHEYFRRILCNLFGDDMENGELPNDTAWIGGIVQDICYNNARNYFGW